jgi:hypothetical protein
VTGSIAPDEKDPGREVRLSANSRPVVGWLLVLTIAPGFGGGLTWLTLQYSGAYAPWSYAALITLPLLWWWIFESVKEELGNPRTMLMLAGDDFVVKEYWLHTSRDARFPITPESRPRLVERRGSEGERLYRIEITEPSGRIITVGQRVWASFAEHLIADIDWHIDRR